MKNKKSILFISVGILILIVAAIIFSFSDKPIQSNTVQNINTNLDVSTGDNEIFDNKLDAYKKEMQDSLRKKNDNVNLDKFGAIETGFDNFSNDNVDSIAVDSIKISKDLIEVMELKKEPVKTSKSFSTKKRIKEKKQFAFNSNKNLFNELKTPVKQPEVNADEWLAEQSSLNQKISKKKSIKTDNNFNISIYGDQYIKNNSRVKMITNGPVIIQNKTIPKNTIIYGFAKFGKNRIYISVKKIKNIRVNYEVVDANDLYRGVYVENENLLDEIKDETTDETLSRVDNMGIINTAKKLFKKKNKENKIFLINNYKLKLIKNEN